MADDDRVDDLYELPPGAFVAARDALAKDLRAEGDRAAAAEVRRLRRPTVAAWTLNQLARRHRDDVEALVELGQQLAAAQEEALRGGRAELRSLGRARMDAVRTLTRAADALLAEVGGASHRDEIAASLTAASADPAAGAELLEARLAEALEAPTGFFGGMPDEAGAPARPPSRRRAPAGASTTTEGAAAEAARAQRAAAVEAATAARADADRAEADAAAAADVAAAAARHVASVEAELAAARAAADEASAAAEAAGRAASEASLRADEHERVARELSEG